MGRYTEHGRLPPDDPIFKQGLTVYTPLKDRGPGPQKKADDRDKKGEDPPES